MASVDLSMPGAALYQRLLAQAAGAGAAMLTQVLMAARQSMCEDFPRVRGMIEREQLELSVRLLGTHMPRMSERFPVILSEVFRRSASSEAKLAGPVLHLDQLELMDEGQVQERVEMARMLQHLLAYAEVALAELNTYVCALIGLNHVSPDRNPLRPEAYVNALQQLMTEMKMPTRVRSIWLHYLGTSLGEALNTAYLEWSAQLQGQRVLAVGYSVVRTPQTASTSTSTSAPDKGGQRRSDRKVWTPEYRETVLTLNRLHRLMAGGLDTAPENPQQAFARKFTDEFESSRKGGYAGQQADTGFEATMPAALDALDMQQVQTVVQRMQQRPATVAGRTEASTGALVRDELTQKASAMSQVLSLEVVSLMVENLIKDVRLLPPVRKIIERLEPALLRLVIIDPRFFIAKEHPARRLLQAIAQRGLAYGTVDDPDFNTFLLTLQRHVSPLAVMQIDSAEPFDAALKNLLAEWDDARTHATIASQINNAAAALGYAEKRNLLALQMADQLKGIPDMHKVPPAVLEFLTGPWTQVMAEAELKDTTGADDPGGYKALVTELLWSAQPDLTRKNVARLTKLVSRLLATLRDGLGLIGYPSVKTSAFFDVLMKLHQQAFRPTIKTAEPKPLQGLAPSLLSNQDHWVAPAEAKASGFMALTDDPPPTRAAAPVRPVPEIQVSAAALTVGAWLELEIKGVLLRTQLSWISTHSTMYLFTSVHGKTQSMTKRMLEHLLTTGKLRVVSDQTSMIDGALDAVVQTAMRNSLELDP